jgi:hypothetical protein
VTTDAIHRHCLQIDRCNQRGGRMLSIVDLIDAGTFSRDLAAYALAAIGRGASFLVGANPGGAGKTAVMGALLNFVPPDVELATADGLSTIDRGLRSPSPRRCFICHEIGQGGYYAYLWADELRAYFQLPSTGHMLATNLHADTYEQVRDQICVDNDVPEADLSRMNLMFFLSLQGSGRGHARRIASAWESDGANEHLRVFDPASSSLGGSRIVSAGDIAEARSRIDRLIDSGARTIEQVRGYLLEV